LGLSKYVTKDPRARLGVIIPESLVRNEVSSFVCL